MLPIDHYLARCTTDSNDCWLWPGSQTNGYATIGVIVNGKSTTRRLHRLVYESMRGPIPKGLQIDHLCRVRNCVNPAHMEPVPPRVNTLRGVGPAAVNAVKTHCPRGHALKGDNLFIQHYKSGGKGRSCKKCRSDAYQEWVRKNPERRREINEAYEARRRS